MESLIDYSVQFSSFFCQVFVFGKEIGNYAKTALNFKISSFSKIPSLKLFGNLSHHSYIQFLVIILWLHFTRGEGELGQHVKSLKIFMTACS